MPTKDSPLDSPFKRGSFRPPPGRLRYGTDLNGRICVKIAAFWRRLIDLYSASIHLSLAWAAVFVCRRAHLSCAFYRVSPDELTGNAMSRNVKTIFIACALMSLALAAKLAQAQPGPVNTAWKRAEISVPVCSKPPKIDGVLDDPCWKTAAHADRFFRLTSPVAQQTDAWITADSSHLYVAFRCLDSDPHAIRAMETQRNGNTWPDDYVCVDIDSQNERHSYSQFIVTARGTQNESLEGGTADNITWAGDWHAATQRTNDGWTCEVSIPFALLRYPRDAHAFGIQLERKVARETSSEFWPNRPTESQSNPVEYFGQLTNVDPVFYRPQPIF